jgi:hypothetical protein
MQSRNTYTKLKFIGSIVSFTVQIVGWVLAGTTIAFWVMGLVGSFVFAAFMGWMVWGYYNRLRTIENARPNIALKKAQGWQFHTKGAPSYYAVQAWFTNNPKVPSADSVGRDVTATVTFYGSDGKHEFEINGCWTQPDIVEHAEIVAAKDLRNQIDSFAPNDIPQKLLIALKWPDDEVAYGLSKPNFYTHQNLKQSGRELKKGTHYVRILFRGVNIDQEPFWLVLDNPGQQGELSLSEAKVPPTLDEEVSHV